MFDEAAIRFRALLIACKVACARFFSAIGDAMMAAAGAASDAVDAMGAARRRHWPAVRDWLASAFAPIIPYLRSRTNWAQFIQFAGIALAAPISAGDLETWSTRAWLLASAVVFVAGVLFRGPKHAPPAEPAAYEPPGAALARSEDAPRFMGEEDSRAVRRRRRRA